MFKKREKNTSQLKRTNQDREDQENAEELDHDSEYTESGSKR